MKTRIAILVTFALFLGVAAIQAAPDATTSEYLKTTGGGISIAGGAEPLYYSLMLSVRKSPDAPLYARATFERPGKKDEPLVSDAVLEPGKRSLLLESPTFQGIEEISCSSTWTFRRRTCRRGRGSRSGRR